MNMEAATVDVPEAEGGDHSTAVLWSEAVADILNSTLRDWRLWWALSWNDTRARYRRTVLGPWWIVLGTGISLSGMGLVWGTLFGMNMKEFFPYLVAGYIAWQFIFMIISEGCSVFIEGHAAAIQLNFPSDKFIHVLRMTMRNTVLFWHTFFIFVVATLVGDVSVNWNSILVIPGFVLVLLNSLWMGLFLGVLGARYRDLSPLVNAVMGVLFFVTPVVWRKEQLGDRGFLAEFNPFTHFLAVIREPLLGQPMPMVSVIVTCALLAVGGLLALWLFAATRRQLAFWI